MNTGKKFAMISIKVIIATLIRTFEFKIEKRLKIDEIKLQMDLFISSVEPLKIKLEKRHWDGKRCVTKILLFNNMGPIMQYVY